MASSHRFAQPLPPRSHDRADHTPRSERNRPGHQPPAAASGDNQFARQKLDRYLDKLAVYLPGWLCRTVKLLREPERIVLRAFVSLLLIVGGVLSFLPVLGIWMLPLGLIIISQDLAFLQRPLATSLAWIERRWQSWRAR
jgi:hypothetical protein